MRRGSSSSGPSTTELDKRLVKVENAIKLSKSFDTYLTKQTDKEWSYEPQMPFYIKRKNERFEYLFLSLMVTSKGNENVMNSLGDAGWFTNAMSIVDEDSGTASFIFKLHLMGARYGTYAVNPCKFKYKCFSYELAQAWKLEGTINDLNKQGYDFLQTAAWNKTHSFCFLMKTIY